MPSKNVPHLTVTALFTSVLFQFVFNSGSDRFTLPVCFPLTKSILTYVYN